MKTVEIMYKPVGLALGLTGGLLAGAVFRQVWKVVGGQDEAPEATDQDRGWTEILVAAALQGAVFSTVKAAVGRGGAVTVHRLTGTWPD
ncbi:MULTISPECIES: DUF4235 domain-containing protein [unclassified Streptomyces]|uniref:DUF4235 domain-containing protein n=2 Tax=Streptomyces TaxID=1883 RepID=A0ABU2RQ06_9ACTN|nr:MULTISPECIES: DUF4235 domain-containing protein [unclassified Streptomyces]AEN08379.1 conserved hypothetical protein [Streptomyces sp. SirexAA-E]MBK3593721.1 DUF4235 domain-containing protein [Streptomyces sp. MBT51]MDT0429449.1 DUF4235 domain-containing protein [Streptomyces sp. DSM 41770]MYR66362.1 DUF4235 domain-containing protein [Streptomyces sp. SID4939]MYS03911.1 DUF4235 domain-containing protein [Streptomyces sp. SID4940]